MEKKTPREEQNLTTKSKTSPKTKKKKAPSQNREFAVITYSFLALFICLMGYFSYFQFEKSEDFIDNPYNTRQETFEQKVVRGKILASGGEVLAETITDSEGNDTRRYPYGSIFAHVVGYSTHGKTGIESQANFDLLRSNTFFLEKAGNEIQGEKSIGDNVITTLNYELQLRAYDALDSYDGAVVVMEPATGKILAMVSKPDFDPNTIAEDWETLTAETNTDAALLNRATQGLYPPGSIFKIVTTLEYLNEHGGDSDYSYTCNGSYTVGNHTIHCYNNKSHGTQNLKQAFSNSCNAAYSAMGLELDIDKFGELCDTLLFNTSLPTKFESSKSSFVLQSTDGEASIMSTAFGQGKTLVTPFHMALLVSAVANDGVLMQPYVIDHTESYEGTVQEREEPEEYGRLISLENAQMLQDYMSAVVESGTGQKLKGQNYEAAGKTGSAEFSTGSNSAHSWFVGYAHQEGKEDIAVAVIVEDSGIGSEYAVPIAKEIFDSYYENYE